MNVTPTAQTPATSDIDIDSDFESWIDFDGESIPQPAVTEADYRAADAVRGMFPLVCGAVKSASILAGSELRGTELEHAALTAIAQRLRREGASENAVVLAMIELMPLNDSLYPGIRRRARDEYVAEPVIVSSILRDTKELTIETASQLLGRASIPF